jgi:hypothetical protein
MYFTKLGRSLHSLPVGVIGADVIEPARFPNEAAAPDAEGEL